MVSLFNRDSLNLKFSTRFVRKNHDFRQRLELNGLRTLVVSEFAPKNKVDLTKILLYIYNEVFRKLSSQDTHFILRYLLPTPTFS